MHEDVTFEPLEPTPQAPAGPADLRRLRDVTVEVAVEIGRTRMTIGETLSLRPGTIITLDRLAGEPGHARQRTAHRPRRGRGRR